MKVMLLRVLFITLFVAVTVFSQAQPSGPPIEPGVSQALAQWRAERYSDVRYKLNLTLEKMSPVLKGTIEIRVNVLTLPRGTNFTNSGLRVNTPGTPLPSPTVLSDNGIPPIILDWRKLKGHEDKSTISNVTINGRAATEPREYGQVTLVGEGQPQPVWYWNEHLIFWDGVVAGENVIKLDFTSPILTSGSAITRYVDKEDGAEYIYSLFVPSDASTAFPVFDQPDLKARFELSVVGPPSDWKVISNTPTNFLSIDGASPWNDYWSFPETKPISTYVFAFAAGPFSQFDEFTGDGTKKISREDLPEFYRKWGQYQTSSKLYVRKSQAAKFKPHAAEVFRLNREGIKYLETYFDYKFPFPKYDLVLIPEFPFGGMEHAGATFLREASIIFPTEPTKSDHISRANLMFHEAAHQWFGDTVTMRWFDDLWLKEGFAEFMAYKTLEKVMPEANAWKVFYERNKQAAYLTDSTKGTTPIYQKIDNLSAAKSAYGNIVYRKASSFLRQAEFYLGEQKFQTAARAFLKKHEFANAGWEDLVKEFERVGDKRFMSLVPGENVENWQSWASTWIRRPGLPKVHTILMPSNLSKNVIDSLTLTNQPKVPENTQIIQSYFGPEDRTSVQFDQWGMQSNILVLFEGGSKEVRTVDFAPGRLSSILNIPFYDKRKILLAFPNYQDYGYGIFLLDEKSRQYVLKNIQNEKDPFLRSMMWGALWDSVREAELDPREYVELAIRQLGGTGQKPARSKGTRNIDQSLETDETIIQSLLGRVGTAMNYYLPDAQRNAIAPRLESVLLDRLQHAPTAGQRITFYRAFVTTASTAKGREVLKEMLAQGSPSGQRPAAAVSAGSRHSDVPLRTKDRFDIVTRLIILDDPDAPKQLAQLEKTETGDDAKRYAYAARAGIATAENKAKYWSDFTANKDISESWIEAAFGPFNSVRHSDLTLPYLERALAELPNHKRTRKIFFVNGWLGAFIGGQKSEAALAVVNKFLSDNPTLDRDLRLKILENVDLIERAVKIRKKFSHE